MVQELVCQIAAVPSALVVMSQSPSNDAAQLVSGPRWLCSVALAVQVAASHITSAPSSLVVASQPSVGENAVPVTGPS
jgi:hypothetical protein